MSFLQELGVQSYCFRHFKTNEEVAAKVREIGLSRIELCGVHADFSQPEAFREVAALYREAGIAIDSLGVVTFKGADEERSIFECASIAGTKAISAHFTVDTFLTAIPKVRRWSQEFAIPVGIHCHGGYMFGGSPDVLRYLTALGGPEVGIWIDTAWAMQIGPRLGQPVKWVEEFAGRIHGIHLKDFTFAPNGQWQDTLVGEGTLDLPAFVAALRQAGFHGATILEYEGDVENPVPALIDCVKAIRQVGAVGVVGAAGGA